MAFKEQPTDCPHCGLSLRIYTVLVNEQGLVRVIGECPNPYCGLSEIHCEIDPLASAAEESAYLQIAFRCPAVARARGN